MWEVPVTKDRKILAHLPAVLLRDKKEKTCLLIDIAIADDSNVNTKATEKTKQGQRPGHRG
jgi:hypothetical protein